MERKSVVSRREALRGGVVVALVVVGCRGNRTLPTCTDTTGLPPDQVKLRETLAYADRAPDPAKTCDHCAQFEPGPSADACGGCKLMKGPICPGGTCKVFAPRA